MNADLFFKFARFKLGSLISAEDFSDRLNYQWSGALLIFFVAVIGLRQYVFTPIQCWVPAEWTKPWEEYAENYCWVQDTYYTKVDEPDFPSYISRESKYIGTKTKEILLTYTKYMYMRVCS